MHNDENKIPVPKWMISFQEPGEVPVFPMKKLFEVFLPPLRWRYFQPEAQKMVSPDISFKDQEHTYPNKNFLLIFTNTVAIQLFLNRNYKANAIPFTENQN